MPKKRGNHKHSVASGEPGRPTAALRTAVAPLGSNVDVLEWLERTYYGTLTSQLGINITYLNQNITWSLTLLTTGLGFILARPSFPDERSLILCTVLWNVVVHLATRAGKAYVNVMRFTIIERDFQAYILGEPPRDAAPSLLESIKTYHWRWASPISRWQVIRKLLLELGFAYTFGLILALWSYGAWVHHPVRWVLWVSATAFVISMFDIYFNLLRSSFLSTVVAHKRILSLR